MAQTRRTALAAITGAAIGCLGLAACGAPMVTELPPPKKAQVVQADPDAFRDFRGEHGTPGKVFRLGGKPMAVDGVEIVVTLVKTDWSTMTAPNGKDIREASANLLVQKGQEERRISLGQGETRQVFGTSITVVAAGENYDNARLLYLAWVDLRVEPAAQ